LPTVVALAALLQEVEGCVQENPGPALSRNRERGKLVGGRGRKAAGEGKN